MRRKGFTPHQFLNYLTRPLNRDEMEIWVKANDIIPERANLFFDFICSLYTVLSDTYLGEEVISDMDDRLGHFKWCWDKVLEDFKKENIIFNEEGEHYDYFWTFFDESFYGNNSEEKVVKMEKFFITLFKLYIEKTKSELDILSDVYHVLNKNLTVDK